MTREQQPGNVQETVRERLQWQTAGRDDAQVAQAIHAGADLDALHELSEAGLLDEFFHFLDTLGVLRLVAELTLPGVERVLIPVVQFVLLYLLKVLFGIRSMNALPPLLFSQVPVMTLLGFNATQIAVGCTRRGEAQRRRKPRQGPLSPQCLAQNICKLPAAAMAGFFNGVVRLLVAGGFVRGTLTVALDGSKLPTTARYAGRGCLAVEREVREKGTRRLIKVVEYVFGWKVLVLIEVQSRLPLALQVVTIEAYEGEWLVPLVEQAQANLGDQAQITKVVVDRGYLDGADLWQLHARGIVFVIVAKAGMAVTEDARSLAGDTAPVTRVQVVRHGHGRQATTEQRVTRLVGIPALTTYDQYGPPEHTRHKNRKDFAGKPLNAVVVRTWNNHEYPEGGIVYLTNGPVTDPFVVFDDYDWRSVIENGIFKEGKHPWHLGHFPQKTEAAVMVHCSFTLAVMALCTAFRLEQAQQTSGLDPAGPPLSSALLQGEGVERWRRRLQAANRDKVIVFVGAAYGIFHLAELAVLGGLRLPRLPPGLGSRPAILARYGLAPDP
jgi:hypothetical protein